jgi:hypothetical protein
MRESNAIVAVYDMPGGAEAGILALRESGFDLQNVSILGPGNGLTGDPVAYYQMPGQIGCWGKMGLFWTGIWDLLFGWAMVSLPEFGPVLVAGPLAMWIIAALDNAPLFGELSAVGGGLYSIGIPRAQTMRYEAALKRQMYLVVVHGLAADVRRAKSVLQDSQCSQTPTQSERRVSVADDQARVAIRHDGDAVNRSGASDVASELAKGRR